MYLLYLYLLLVFGQCCVWIEMDSIILHYYLNGIVIIDILLIFILIYWIGSNLLLFITCTNKIY